MNDFDDAAIEQLLCGGRSDEPAFAVVDDLRRLVQGAAPAPSPRLAAMLAGGCEPVLTTEPAVLTKGFRRLDRAAALLAVLPAAEVARRKRMGRLVAATVLAGGATLGLTGVAAANDALPDPAQSLVRSIMNTITTFHIDLPRDHRTSLRSPTGVASPPADRFDGAAALPRRRPLTADASAAGASTRSSTRGPGPGTRAPAGGANGSTPAPTTRKQRSAHAAAHVNQSVARTSQLHKVKQRLKRQLRHQPPPSIWRFPITVPELGSFATPAVAHRPSRDGQGQRPRTTELVSRSERVAKAAQPRDTDRSSRAARAAKAARAVKAHAARVARARRAAKAAAPRRPHGPERS